ncbi:MAG: undecaprenyl-diphosphate phosphatase [Eubacteriales bacterium]|nr:undecaprenyl-diphosphate phosphatase [Eubacteriales bacterium]
MDFIELLKILLFGIVEGYTEWLPISSTGHLILVEELVHLNQPEAFWNVFKVVIQLGAILAVVVLYWKKLWPFSREKTRIQKRNTWMLWSKIIIACLPAAIVGLPLDDILDNYLSTPTVIAIMLIAYGIAFIWLEHQNKSKYFPIMRTADISYRTALFIGMFQCLSLVPGTSRSGATILGAMLLGCGRAAAAEFSFYLGIPVMFGASLLKILKYGFEAVGSYNPFVVLINGFGFNGSQWVTIILGMSISFIVALYTIRYLMSYIRKHDFAVFGYYRIVLGIVVLLYFGMRG